MKKAIFGVCIAALLGACESYDEGYHGTHRHTYYRERVDRPYAYDYDRGAYYHSDQAFSSDFPYTTQRAYVRPGGVRVYRY